MIQNCQGRYCLSCRSQNTGCWILTRKASADEVSSVIQVACHHMLFIDSFQLRLFLLANFLALAASGAERTAGWRINGGRYISLKNDPVTVPVLLRIRNRYCAHQAAGIWMEHILIQFIHLGIFNQIAQIHHTDLVADMAHHGQIVTDKQIGKAVFILQFFQNIDYLCLDGHIKCRNRLVTYNELRIGRQRLAIPIL